MRHGMRGRKFNRTRGERRALLSNLAVSLLQHEQIQTTLPKAKDLRPLVEKMITLGKKGTLAARRQMVSFLRDKDLQKKLTDTLAPRYAARAGGYTRIIKAGFRYGDNAPLAIIELVDRDVSAKGKSLAKAPTLSPTALAKEPPAALAPLA